MAAVLAEGPQLTLRAVTEADIPLLTEWRNDPEARANSNYTGLVDPYLFERQLKLRMADPNSELLLGLIDDTPVGHVRIEGEVVSFMVAPEHRGMGIGRALIAGISHRTPLRAEVREHNRPSWRIFESLGWRRMGAREGFRVYAL